MTPTCSAVPIRPPPRSPRRCARAAGPGATGPAGRLRPAVPPRHQRQLSGVGRPVAGRGAGAALSSRGGARRGRTPAGGSRRRGRLLRSQARSADAGPARSRGDHRHRPVGFQPARTVRPDLRRRGRNPPTRRNDHRGTVGAMERVVAALLERYSGRLPLWLAPVQVCVLPISAAQDDYARALVHDLCAAELRARLDTDGSLGARIRASRRRRDNIIAVTGPAEASADLVHVTDPSTNFTGPVARATFVATVRGAQATRARRVAWPALDTDHHSAGRP